MTRHHSDASPAVDPAVSTLRARPEPDKARPIQLALLIDDEEIDQMMYRRVITRSDMVE